MNDKEFEEVREEFKTKKAKDKSPEGLYQKYFLERSDGTPIPDHAKYFVLRFDDDKDARTALRLYAALKSEEFKLSKDLQLDVLIAELEDQNSDE